MNNAAILGITIVIASIIMMIVSQTLYLGGFALVGFMISMHRCNCDRHHSNS